MSSPWGKPWFVPKHWGYGATPSTWEGWASIAVFTLLLVADMVLLHGAARWLAGGALTLAYIFLCYWKTSEPWRWRWGED